MLIWFAETTLIASILAGAALIGGRWSRVGPAARHALWLAVLIKLVAPPIVNWPRPPLFPWEVAREAKLPLLPIERGAIADGLASDEVGVTGVDVPRPSSPQPPSSRAASPGIGIVPPDLTTIRRAILIAWAAATATIVLAFGTRVARFRRSLLGGALPPPRWIEDEARLVARSLGVRAPEILLIPAATTPMLWFLGRPRLLLPARLVDVLGADAWRGILAHELAHLRRRDHWVRRLELLAGLLWWWNPIYWLTRRRLEAEAELACDEWDRPRLLRGTPRLRRGVAGGLPKPVPSRLAGARVGRRRLGPIP